MCGDPCAVSVQGGAAKKEEGDCGRGVDWERVGAARHLAGHISLQMLLELNNMRDLLEHLQLEGR